MIDSIKPIVDTRCESGTRFAWGGGMEAQNAKYLWLPQGREEGGWFFATSPQAAPRGVAGEVKRVVPVANCDGVARYERNLRSNGNPHVT